MMEGCVAISTPSDTPGKYVAIDMASDEVVLTADTPQELHDRLQAKGLLNVAVMRAPREDESVSVWRTMGC
jgi:hypothetical protein